jgi:hypothetical protein
LRINEAHNRSSKAVRERSRWSAEDGRHFRWKSAGRR